MFNYNLDKQIINVVNNEKDLGVIIDKGLSFYTHIAEKVKIANQRVGLIKRCFNFLNSKAL